MWHSGGNNKNKKKQKTNVCAWILYIKHHDLGIHQWILFLVCGHFGVLKIFFRALEEASTGPWTRFSLHGFFECTGCQGRLLTLHAQGTERRGNGHREPMG